jgi:hypothetical protein
MDEQAQISTTERAGGRVQVGVGICINYINTSRRREGGRTKADGRGEHDEGG